MSAGVSVAVRGATNGFRRQVRASGTSPAVTYAVTGCGLVLAIGALVLIVLAWTTDAPFLVSRFHDSDDGPAPMGLRVGLTVVLGGFLALFAVAFMSGARKPRLALDDNGVWLTKGKRSGPGLPWSDITAVTVATTQDATTVPAETATVPLVEVFPAKGVHERGQLATAFEVNAPSPGHGLRGKRFVFQVAGTPEELAAFGAAADRLSPKESREP
ncbi:hypothetical protein EV193_11836 [Herbihabitans rhizosphaerae]|uniref:Uncharacterized protein n=1 Tax=Herbihabitans rhizosphaerae TaxID=1872711 RepID=A0A4Q7KBZ9_9PSEU|nr:hypothetical protein [Herbihabitans rhizosphaerae]RZS29782.1 hypothetical protein EV193_11836 [Herbihabitans rhizosphaerae]